MGDAENRRDSSDRRSSPRGERRSRLALIVANLLPLAGVILLGWDLLSVLLLYWLEMLVLCCLALLRVLRCFGGHAFSVLLLFLLAVAAMGAGQMAVLVVLAEAVGLSESAIPDLSKVAEMPLFSALGTLYGGGLEWIARDRPALLLYALPLLVLSQVVELWSGPTLDADRGQDSARVILRQVLGRVILLQLALLLGSAVIAATDTADMLPVLALLVLFKLFWELGTHHKSARKAMS